MLVTEIHFNFHLDLDICFCHLCAPFVPEPGRNPFKYSNFISRPLKFLNKKIDINDNLIRSLTTSILKNLLFQNRKIANPILAVGVDCWVCST